MLASGAHVKIGDYEFRLAMDQDDAYDYSMNTISQATDFWLFQDWSGGEGNDSYDTNDPNVYHQGLVNPRNPGELTTPPARAVATTATLSPTPNTALSVIAGGRLYLIGEQISAGACSYWHTVDLTNFTEMTDSGWNTAVDYITAACTDGTYFYLFGSDTGTGNAQARRIKGSTGAQVNIVTYADLGLTEIRGIGVLGGYLYFWDGTRLKYINIATNVTTPGTTPKTRFTGATTTTGLTYGTDYWAGMCNGEGSLYFFSSTEGVSTVYEVTRQGACYPIWSMPSGFTAKGITYQSGAVLLAGEYQNNSCLFGMSTISRQPLFLGFVRYGSSVSIETIGNGFGSEVILAERDASSAGGKVFIYDLAADAFSELDELSHTSGECWSVGVYLNKRFAVVEDGNDLNLYNWDFDTVPSTTVNGRMETGVWDFGTPEDLKVLDGFHVLSDANSTKTVDVYYMDNEDGTWTSAGTATTGFHNYITVSNASATVSFRALRFRVDPKTGATVYAVSARVRSTTYEQQWVLRLDLSDEAVEGPYPHKRHNAQFRGWQLRDYLRTIAEAKTIVTFLDGAKYPQDQGDDPDKYTTHTVTVDIPRELLDREGEGTMYVRLRSVATN